MSYNISQKIFVALLYMGRTSSHLLVIRWIYIYLTLKFWSNYKLHLFKLGKFLFWLIYIVFIFFHFNPFNLNLFLIWSFHLRVCLDWAYFCWNWKYCSEIIFKCVNSVVGPIFNKNVVKKCNLWDRKQYTYALFTVDKVNYCGLEKKKEKKKKRKT